MYKLFWLPVFWFIAAVVAYEWNLNGVFLVVALAVGTAVALWVTTGEGKESDK
jgi:hypothetical protein